MNKITKSLPVMRPHVMKGHTYDKLVEFSDSNITILKKALFEKLKDVPSKDLCSVLSESRSKQVDFTIQDPDGENDRKIMKNLIKWSKKDLKKILPNCSKDSSKLLDILENYNKALHNLSHGSEYKFFEKICNCSDKWSQIKNKEIILTEMMNVLVDKESNASMLTSDSGDTFELMADESTPLRKVAVFLSMIDLVKSDSKMQTLKSPLSADERKTIIAFMTLIENHLDSPSRHKQNQYCVNSLSWFLQRISDCKSEDQAFFNVTNYSP